VIAWFLRGLRAKSHSASLAAGLTTLEQTLAALRAEHDIVKSTHAQLQRDYHAEAQGRAVAEERAARVAELAARLDDRDQQLMQRGARIAALETQLVEKGRAIEEQRQLLEQSRVAFADSFKALSAEALKSNNQAFMELAKATLDKTQEGSRNDLDAKHRAVDELVRPLQESLLRVDGKLGEIEKERITSHAALNEQLRALLDTHLPVLRNETANLAKALRQSTVRGRWGELQLKRVVEMAGMLEHCDFTEQESRTTEEGRVRPDLIIKLPGGRQIVVDSKAPLAAYLDAHEATEESARRLALTRHAQLVRGHMVSLGRKSYWEEFKPTPDFVIMFLPGEVFWSAALQEDPALIECGVEQKVIAATPTTLIALLRAVAYGWRQEALAQNAQEVARLGKELYERLGILGEHWNKMGERLGQAVEAYNRSTATLETRVLVSARRFRDLKVGAADDEIETMEQIETAPRAIQAAELVDFNARQLSIGIEAVSP
jgi:DNA recombination protein RmuC